MRHNPSLNAFFNALIREWPIARYHESVSTTDQGHFEIQGSNNTSLIIPCRFRAYTGRHLLAEPLQIDDQGERQPVTFEQAVAWCLGLEPLLHEASGRALEALQQRVHASRGNLAAAQQERESQLDHLFREPLTFIEAEQALFSGHSIHPCPKDRGNMDSGDARRYAPEYGTPFPLAWYSVDRAQLFRREAGGFQSVDGVDALLETEPDADHLRAQLPEGHCLLPCHPFQHRQWQASPGLAPMLESGAVRYLGEGAPHWYATSSLRAIYCDSAPWMLKFSLSVWLTNSLRHLYPEEVVRGAELCRVLDSGPVREWLQSRPRFEILREPITAGIRGPEGQPLTETLLVWRDNPFHGDAANNTEVLATLLQDDPRSGDSRLAQRLGQVGLDDSQAREWFRRYLDVAVAPLLEAQSHFGILFGAHQQNLVLKLDGVWPEKLFFRDCQGTAFTSLAVQRLGDELGSLADDSENLLPDELGIQLFCYYLFINATFNVITSLAAGRLASEAALIRTLREWLQARLDEQPRDDRAIRYLLESRELHAKGNFLCTLRALNETTLSDVFSIYHPMTNPLYTEAECHV
ncbi:IucA/IucC family protein [uncultured Halovibrio sp.]|uniref:IucA/IucC family protein n=1 Tax=uncultured Halovibrio sp. TaxID=985049 RepID=UPI0025EB5894|nr:IucA/IucC family protein [uncultured Halovibrio sp.]